MTGKPDLVCTGTAFHELINDALRIFHQLRHHLTHQTGRLCHCHNQELAFQNLINVVTKTTPAIVQINQRHAFRRFARPGAVAEIGHLLTQYCCELVFGCLHLVESICITGGSRQRILCNTLRQNQLITDTGQPLLIQFNLLANIDKCPGHSTDCTQHKKGKNLYPVAGTHFFHIKHRFHGLSPDPSVHIAKLISE